MICICCCLESRLNIKKTAPMKQKRQDMHLHIHLPNIACFPPLTISLNVSSPPIRFLLECLEDLDSSLRKLNSRLFLIRGQPADVLPRLFKVIHALLVSHFPICLFRPTSRRRKWVLGARIRSSNVPRNCCWS